MDYFYKKCGLKNIIITLTLSFELIQVTVILFVGLKYQSKNSRNKRNLSASIYWFKVTIEALGER